MLENLRKGDEVIAQKLDRISRSIFELHKIALEIEEKGGFSKYFGSTDKY